MAGEQVSVGRVFSRGFGVIGDNPVPVLGVAFLVGAIPMVAFSFYQLSVLQGGMDPDQVWGVLAFTYGSSLVSMVFQSIAQGALVRATLAYVEGERASLGESLNAGLVVVLPLIGISIVSALGVAIGFVLLIVPGIILMLMWAVATPALVVERIGVFEALQRSRDLTRGARGHVLGVLVILGVASWIFAAVVNAVLLGTGFSTSAMAELAVAPSIGSIAVEAVLSTITIAFGGTVISSLYIELRNAKEGPETQALADIFS